jgi:hypothetical protein
MNAKPIFYLLPLLLLSACSSRQPGQPSAQEPSAQQPQQAHPAAPHQRASAPAAAPTAIPAGTVFDVRLDETLDTKHNRAGDRFFATLMDPIQVGRTTVIPRGALCAGHLVESNASGRFTGQAHLSLSLDSFEVSGQRHKIDTFLVARVSGGHKKRNLIFIGGATTALGVTAQAFTGKKNVRLPAESAVAFSLRSPVALTSVAHGGAPVTPEKKSASS